VAYDRGNTVRLDATLARNFMHVDGTSITTRTEDIATSPGIIGKRVWSQEKVLSSPHVRIFRGLAEELPEGCSTSEVQPTAALSKEASLAIWSIGLAKRFSPSGLHATVRAAPHGSAVIYAAAAANIPRHKRQLRLFAARHAVRVRRKPTDGTSRELTHRPDAKNLWTSSKART
jgi:hypothetical protein